MRNPLPSETEPDPDLARLFAAPLDDLLDRHRDAFRSERRPPAWRITHVDRHLRDEGRKTRPESEPFILALCAWISFALITRLPAGAVGTAFLVGWAMGSGGVTALVTAARRARGFTRAGALREALLLVACPATSLYLTFKAYAAFRRWEGNGATWDLEIPGPAATAADILEPLRRALARHRPFLANLPVDQSETAINPKFAYERTSARRRIAAIETAVARLERLISERQRVREAALRKRLGLTYLRLLDSLVKTTAVTSPYPPAKGDFHNAFFRGPRSIPHARLTVLHFRDTQRTPHPPGGTAWIRMAPS